MVLATKNKKKVEEIQRVLAGLPVTLLTIADFPDMPDVVEDGDTFEANAVKKGVEIARHTGCMALADDSGLVVDALDGAPGVYSARFAGPDADDLANSEKLLRDLEAVPEEKRSARFVCVLALVDAQGKVHTFEGKSEGTIGWTPKGVNGFGYDPLFYPQGHRRTFAEMSNQEKDERSHRGFALVEFARFMKASQTS
ncbi:MAG: XTP/dITP diphosphatase [Magnetococcales bacterium]|nr:XTP/dITP diphosphatase [Magnetococcales bacterium]